MATPRELPRPPRLDTGDALFLDFDGTLVEIAATSDRVAVPASLPALLERVADRLGGALAVISGRGLADLARILDGYRGAVIGLHGLEHRGADGRVAAAAADPAIDLVWPMLRQFATTTEGVLLEDKGAAIAIHYRGQPELEAACARLAAQAAQLSGGRLVVKPGKMLFELHPPGAHKGRAILACLAEPPFRDRRPVLIGDDRTDEDGFAAVNSRDGISIHVGDAADTLARYRLGRPAEVVAWLDALVRV